MYCVLDDVTGLPLIEVNGLAFDPKNRRLYYTDSGPNDGPNVICSMNIDSSDNRIVIRDANGMDEPRAIALALNTRSVTLINTILIVSYTTRPKVFPVNACVMHVWHAPARKRAHLCIYIHCV